MATYEQRNFEEIATAIGVKVERIAKHESLFEAAALWHRLNTQRPTRIPPSKLREKLDPVAKNAYRLLKSLGINDLDKALDGPGDPEIFSRSSCWASATRTLS